MDFPMDEENILRLARSKKSLGALSQFVASVDSIVSVHLNPYMFKVESLSDRLAKQIPIEYDAIKKLQKLSVQRKLVKDKEKKAAIDLHIDRAMPVLWERHEKFASFFSECLAAVSNAKALIFEYDQKIKELHDRWVGFKTELEIDLGEEQEVMLDQEEADSLVREYEDLRAITTRVENEKDLVEKSRQELATREYEVRRIFLAYEGDFEVLKTSLRNGGGGEVAPNIGKPGPIVNMYPAGAVTFPPGRRFSYQEVQQRVRDILGHLALETRSECSEPGQPGSLSLAQNVVYHYANPFNPNADTMIDHSAGSGKSSLLQLVGSAYMRAGYRVLYVTTEKFYNQAMAKAPENPYFEAAFEQGADINIQEFLAVNNAKNLAEVMAREFPELKDFTSEEIQMFGVGVWRRMGIEFNPKMDIITFPQLTRLARMCFSNRIPNIVPQREAAQKRGGTGEDIFYKTVVLIDETHNLTSEMADAEQRLNPVIIARAFWRSREMSGPNSVVVFEATATPAERGWQMVMQANMLVPRELGIDLDPDPPFKKGDPMPDYKFNFLTKVDVYEKEFERQFPKGASLLENRKMLSLLAGHVSFLDMRAEKNVLAQPLMRTVPVQVVGVDQFEAVQKCLEKLPEIDIQVVWQPGGNFTVRKKEKAPYDWRTGKEEAERSISGKKKVDVLDKMKKCLLAAQYMARDPRIQESMRTSKRITGPIAAKVTPLFAKLVELVRENAPKGKQAIYLDTDNEQEGLQTVENLLENLAGFKAVKSVQEAEKIQSKGVISLSKALEGLTKSLLGEYNSWEKNRNGIRINLVLLDAKAKEGISLADVAFLYIVGLISSPTALFQAIARAFRTCRSQHLPLGSDGERNVMVFLVTPMWPNGASLSLLLNQIVPPDELKNEFTQLLREVAYDKLILGETNRKSQEIENRILEASQLK